MPSRLADREVKEVRIQGGDRGRMKEWLSVHKGLKFNVVCKLKKGEDPDEFALWAFGPNFDFFQIYREYMDSWNSLHSDKLKLTGDLTINESLAKMIEVWRHRSD